MIHEIKNLIWLETPKGRGVAKFLIDYGSESDLYWVVFITITGECWTFANSEIRASQNITLGRDNFDVEGSFDDIINGAATNGSDCS